MMLGIPSDYWGKFEHADKGQIAEWHPLFCHCADVAMCTKTIIERSIIGARIARLCEVPRLSPQIIDRLAVLAALHDFGKTNHGFQAKSNRLSLRTAGHVYEAQAALLQTHHKISGKLVEALDLQLMLDWFSDEDSLVSLFRTILAHHGKPVNSKVVDPTLWQEHAGRNPIEGVARLTSYTKQWFPLAWEPNGDKIPHCAELQHAFAGLLMLSDWIGSNIAFFPFAQKWPDVNYHRIALEQATRAIENMGIDSISVRRGMQLGTDLFKTLFSDYIPRAAQRCCLDLPVGSGPSITVLEAETGAGKTEAAVARFAALFAASEVDGLYFALPTRTAATEIHKRVVKAIARMFPDVSTRPAVIMAVPGYLCADDIAGLKLPRFKVLWPDDPEQRNRYRYWAAENAKRYLAGVVVIGTIDQALLSTLAVGHSHLRAVALLRHLLVIDEVHASDTYMTRLTEAVLARHWKAGGHALLMSATLGATARNQLLHPETRKLSPSLATALSTPYPLVSHRDDGGVVDEIKVDRSNDRPPKIVNFTLAALADDPPGVAQLGVDAAKAGAKVLIIRNTVKDCIATQLKIEVLATESKDGVLFQCKGVATPHHARYSPTDRRLLDAAIKKSFGTDRPSGGCVAVATQTIQQSLDLDADLILTDLCPMDVLLQRVGRLHRHENQRAVGFQKARCIVLTPNSRDLSCFLETQRRGNTRNKLGNSHGLGTVYEDLSVIEATWQVLSQNHHVTIPDDNRRLVEEAVHPEALGSIVANLGPLWEDEKNRNLGKYAADRCTANLNLVNWDVPFDGTTMLFPNQNSAGGQRISTRLGEGSRRVLFETPFSGPFCAPVQELIIPAHLALGIPSDATPSSVVQEESSVSFVLGTTAYIYDRLGIRQTTESDRKES